MNRVSDSFRYHEQPTRSDCIIQAIISTPYPMDPYQKHMFSKDQSLFPTHRKLPIRAAANVICSYQLKNRNFNILCLPLSLQSFENVNFLTTSSLLLSETLLQYHQTLGCRSHQEFHRSENIISTKWARKIGKGGSDRWTTQCSSVWMVSESQEKVQKGTTE
jgi:hypothetical protein